MKRALVSSVCVRGLAPSTSLATIGWGRGAQGIVRKTTNLPKRADFFPEPEWKLYEQGDPQLYDNWKGKAPNALAEDADLDPNDYSMCVDRAPQYGSPFGLLLQLCAAFVPLALLGVGAYFMAQYKRDNKEAIKGDYRVYPPETVALFVETEGSFLPSGWHAKLAQIKEQGLL